MTTAQTQAWRKRTAQHLPSTHLPVAPLVAICVTRWRPYDEIAEIQTGTNGMVADVLGMDITAARRWIVAGKLRLDSADKAAVALGLHPAEIWPEWFDL